MPGVVETFKSVIHNVTHGTDFKLGNLLHTKNPKLNQEDLNTSIGEPETRWNIHHVSYGTSNPEQNYQVTANSPTVHGVLGFLMSLICTRLKTMWAGKLR
jgi:hypothetical protein